MAAEQQSMETLEDFKNSFFYGTRADQNFKFLKYMPPEEAGRYFKELTSLLGQSMDDGKFGRIVDHYYKWQVYAYKGKPEWKYDDGPISRLTKPLAQCGVALFTSSGHFVDNDDPEPFGVKNMTQKECEARIEEFAKSVPKLSIIPSNTPPEHLRVRHPGYDVSAAMADPNVIFPIEILNEMAKEGVIGELAPEAYSFVGLCSQLRLKKKEGPKWGDHLRKQNIDAVLLVPG